MANHFFSLPQVVYRLFWMGDWWPWVCHSDLVGGIWLVLLRWWWWWCWWWSWSWSWYYCFFISVPLRFAQHPVCRVSWSIPTAGWKIDHFWLELFWNLWKCLAQQGRNWSKSPNLVLQLGSWLIVIACYCVVSAMFSPNSKARILCQPFWGSWSSKTRWRNSQTPQYGNPKRADPPQVFGLSIRKGLQEHYKNTTLWWTNILQWKIHAFFMGKSTINGHFPLLC